MISQKRAKNKKSVDTVAIVGAGNVARVMAVALLNAGVRVNEIITRDSDESKQKGAKLARYVVARASTVNDAKLDAKIVWLCVADSAIAEVAVQLAKLPVTWKGKVALHPAANSREFCCERLRGCLQRAHPPR